jgi:hypothetical protein
MSNRESRQVEKWIDWEPRGKSLLRDLRLWLTIPSCILLKVPLDPRLPSRSRP